MELKGVSIMLASGSPLQVQTEVCGCRYVDRVGVGVEEEEEERMQENTSQHDGTLWPHPYRALTHTPLQSSHTHTLA